MQANTVARPLERLVHKADFERLLGGRSIARSAHFALHHVNDRPAVLQSRFEDKVAHQPTELSTALTPTVNTPVHNFVDDRLWFGCVVPKRHARRAVTRNLLRRQIRESFERHATSLGPGLWLVRLRSPFAPVDFVSAKSTALARAARTELDGLLARAAG
ncbi:MAG TPA: ribonuclease P protein component [Rubrivivax sp.]|nr:ribonuclease P protein component [Rubrivivax sp.]